MRYIELREWEADGIGSGSYPVVRFGLCSPEPSSYITTALLNILSSHNPQNV
jgi:hypothetical protein